MTSSTGRYERRGGPERGHSSVAAAIAPAVAVVLLLSACSVDSGRLDGSNMSSPASAESPDCERLPSSDGERPSEPDTVAGCSVEAVVDGQGRFTIGVPRGLPETVPDDGPYRSTGDGDPVALTGGYPEGEAYQEMAFRLRGSSGNGDSGNGDPSVYRYGVTRESLDGAPSEGFEPVFREARSPSNESAEGGAVNVSRYELEEGVFVTQRVGVKPATDGEKVSLSWTVENRSGEPVSVTPRLAMDPVEEYEGQGTVSVPGLDDIEYGFTSLVSSLPTDTLLALRRGATTETAAGASLSGSAGGLPGGSGGASAPPERIEVGEEEEILQPDFGSPRGSGDNSLLESSGAYALTWEEERVEPGESTVFTHEYGMAESEAAKPVSVSGVESSRLSAEEALREVPRRLDGSNNEGRSQAMYTDADLRRFPAYRVSAEVENRTGREVEITGESLEPLTEGMSVAGPVKPSEVGEAAPVTGKGTRSLAPGESAPVTFYVLLPSGPLSSGEAPGSDSGISGGPFEAYLSVEPRGAAEVGAQLRLESPAGGASGDSLEPGLPPDGPSLSTPDTGEPEADGSGAGPSGGSGGEAPEDSGGEDVDAPEDSPIA